MEIKVMVEQEKKTSKEKKSERQTIYESYVRTLLRSEKPPSKVIFSISENDDVESREREVRKIQKENPDIKIPLGYINFYCEEYLLATSKDTLKDTHSVFKTETRRYWCQQMGIEPGLEVNQGKNRRGTRSSGSYSFHCLLTVEQAIKMFCCYIRYKIEPESKTPIGTFEDLGIAAFLDFRNKSKIQEIYVLEEVKSLGEIKLAA
jgi:hypothetical protein